MRSRSKVDVLDARAGSGAPAAGPCQAFVVSPGHMIGDVLAHGGWFVGIICRFRPSPKASSSRIATVPQAIAAMVRMARFFWSRAELEEELQDDGEIALHAVIAHSFIATTGSSRDASRAGK